MLGFDDSERGDVGVAAGDFDDSERGDVGVAAGDLVVLADLFGLAVLNDGRGSLIDRPFRPETLRVSSACAVVSERSRKQEQLTCQGR